MSDIALTWDLDQGAADFSIEDNDLAQDGGFETAIMISLFTDRRAEKSDELPDGETDRRGWWGDAFAALDGDRIGSRLWLLSREKDTATVIQRAKEYAEEALAWLVEDGAVSKVVVQTESQIPDSGRSLLAIGVTIYRPHTDPTAFRFNYNWIAQEARRA